MHKKIQFSLLKKRKFYQRIDILPFIVLHIILIIYSSYQQFQNLFLYIIISGVITIFQGIIFISKYFSTKLLTAICYFHVDNINIATDVNITINTNNNKRTTLSKLIRESNIMKFESEKIIYIYDKDKKEFVRSKYEELKTYKIREYLEVKSLRNEEITEKRIKFGENKMKIPIPSFINLYKEHILTPFFIFQIFCTLFKILDNDNFYSLISVIMVCAFEIIIVTHRIINLAFLRKMRTPPYYIYAYRNEQWIEILSKDLLPGDIVSVIDGASVKSLQGEEKNEEKKDLLLQIINRLKENKKKEDQIKNQKNINTVLNKYKEKEKLSIASDMLLLSGSVIVNESMLTGESIPQIKDSITKMDYSQDDILDIKYTHKNSIIFAGTKVVKTERDEEKEPLPKNVKIAPPDGGVICLVIKTGFDTTQGKLIRKELYNQEKTKENNKKNDFLIIGILLIIALFVSFYVLKVGLYREGALTYKLLVRCIIIITSIIPDDLPIELSLIIYNSLFFFESKKIVCIESFRIPWAGKVNICCFDKTGTLTSDEFVMKGIIDTESTEPDLAYDCNEEPFSVLLGCNSLLNIEGRPVGDPIDVVMFKEVRGKFVDNEICCKRKTKITPIKKYIFDSQLKRTTILSKVYSEVHKKNITRVLCKGAPETIKTLLKNTPNNYDECYLKWAKEGYRVLALAYNDNEKFDYNTKREDLEKDLIFCGFVIIETPIKEKADKYIKELINAKYKICIITGDHLLTTFKIAKELKFSNENYILLKIEDKKLNWYNLNNVFVKETKTIKEVQDLYNEYTLCITGDEYKKINSKKDSFNNTYEIIQYIKLFCRITQLQKVDIIKDLLKSGNNPSMCGDGSNDVGALNNATIGVAMLNIKENKIQEAESFNLLSFDNETTKENFDAAAFAPFTSKGDSIKCMKNILVQGRCALVKYTQMYKIFILNGLLTIYRESFLIVKGIKFSQYQSVYLGFEVSMFFLLLSKANPLNKVNSNKPQQNIFTYDSFLSIIGQITVHLIAMNLTLYITEKSDPFFIKQEKSLDEIFTPNLSNTIIFMFNIFNQINIFFANYKGEPFMQNIWDNSFMIKLIVGIFFFGATIIFDLYPQLNEELELVQLPQNIFYKVKIIVIMALNFILCYIIENWKNLFGYFEPYTKSKSKKKKNYYYYSYNY